MLSFQEEFISATVSIKRITTYKLKVLAISFENDRGEEYGGTALQICRARALASNQRGGVLRRLCRVCIRSPRLWECCRTQSDQMVAGLLVWAV